MPNCPACGSDRPDVCELLGHTYPVPYRATGAQLTVHPLAEGIPYGDWLKRASRPTQAEISAWQLSIAPREKIEPAKKPRRAATKPTLL